MVDAARFDQGSTEAKQIYAKQNAQHHTQIAEIGQGRRA